MNWSRTDAHDSGGSNARFVPADNADVLSPWWASLLIHVAEWEIILGTKKQLLRPKY
jgi:hypothetical protein